MIDREWFSSMRAYLEYDLNVSHKYVTDFSLDAVEVDEDCETLLTMVNDSLRKSIESKNVEELLQVLTNYQIRLDHLNDHMKRLLKTIPKIKKILDKGAPWGVCRSRFRR